MDKKQAISVGIVFALALAVLLLIVGGVQAGPGVTGPTASSAAVGNVVSGTISYQGRLLDSNGDPVNGVRTITFRLYDSPGGAAVWSQAISVSVEEGFFTAYLDGVDPGLVDGRALWLGVQLQGEAEMTPRQPLFPVPYALSLRPGAVISGGLAGNENTAVLYAINKGSGAVGLYANGDRAAVHAWSTGGAGILATSQDGFGGEFGSNTSSAVYGGTGSDTSAAIWGENYAAGPGLQGASDTGYGVYGLSKGVAGFFTSTQDIGIIGSSGSEIGVKGHGPVVGVLGESADGFGVLGFSTNDVGVHGMSISSTAGYFTSTHGAGVHANSRESYAAVIGENRGNGVGGYFTSTHGVGLGASSGDGFALATLGPSLIQGPNLQQIALLKWYPAIATDLSFPTGQQPSGIAFDGANIWVANYGPDSVTVLRASTGERVMTCTVGLNPDTIAFDGVNMWVTNRDNNTVSVLRASDCSHVMTPTVGTIPFRLAFDGANMWVVNNGSKNVSVIRASDGTHVMTPTLDVGPRGIAFDGVNMWITNYSVGTVSVIRANDGTHVMTLTAGVGPTAIAFDGANMWVANLDGGTVSVFRASDGALVKTLQPPVIGSGPTALAFDGANMWVVNEYDDTVSIVRVADFGPVATVSVGDRPLYIAFDGANMWISNNNDNTVSKR